MNIFKIIKNVFFVPKRKTTPLSSEEARCFSKLLEELGKDEELAISKNKEIKHLCGDVCIYKSPKYIQI